MAVALPKEFPGLGDGGNRPMTKPLVVLCDFDGTVVEIDTGEFVLARFAEGDWKVFDEMFEKGDISLEECMEKQGSMVKVSEGDILSALRPVMLMRRNFDRFVEYCGEESLPLILVSAGLDFVIRDFLESKGWQGAVKIHAPRATCTPDGIRHVFPTPSFSTSLGFKGDFVRSHKGHGNRVAYIGDGPADYPAARSADIVFAIKGSRLALLCRTYGIPCREVSDFEEVVRSIDRETGGLGGPQAGAKFVIR